MGVLEIFTLMVSLIGTLVGAGAMASANEQNQQNFESSQQFSREAAGTANATTREQYQTLYSPEAKVQQYKDAGLNPALMYMQGSGSVGSAAAQAATPAAPTINPLVNSDWANKMFENVLTATQTKKTEQETSNLQQQLEESKANVRKIESEIDCNIASKTNTELQNRILENEAKVKEATFQEQIEMFKENLRLIKDNADKTEREIFGLDIENKHKDEYWEATVKLLQAQEKETLQKELLEKAQTFVEEAKKFLIDHQDEELEKRLKAIDTYGYMAVNGTGWQTQAIGLLLEALEELAPDSFFKGGLIGEWYRKWKAKKGETYTKEGKPGAGGKF